ncbi:ThuA domain-containing protein, partial [Candidatus Sumerlaeota bacterium]|nr:ThuA domain-containing protein [Candidatus Sumerlaeota bacterium]
YRHGPLSLNFSPGVDHPVSVGLGESVHFEDESYWPLQGDESHVRVLATGVEEGKPRPLVWTFQPGAGRVFCSVPGHYSWTFDDPLYRVIVLRAIAWTGRQQMSRFENLALAGVELLSE